MSRNVLVIEDDNDIAQLVRMQLAGLACETIVVNDGRAGLAEALAKPYNLVILDLMLPGIDGLEICRRLRAERRYTPILMLTARSTELDRVLGLEMGADDYLAKPFSVLELVARVKAIFRIVDMLANPASGERTLIESKDLKIDVEKREVTVRGASIMLTAKEFQLLLHFALNPGRVYTRGQLLDQVWGYSHSGYEHTVNSHINRLRAKIEIDPNSPEYIQTVWGVGYKFRNASSD
ncbi:winged helix-turn-helix domain-containing protein [Burkholderia sp. PU8-34]